MPIAPSFPGRTAKPSLDLALLSALIANSRDRRWLARPVSQLIPEGGPSLERLSRLKAAVLPGFEELLREVTRRGRPPRPSRREDESLVLRELLALVPERAWTYLPRPSRQRVVAAQERLKDEHGLTQKRFCELLGIRERTFRSWKEGKSKKPPRPPSAPPPTEKKHRPRPTGAGRFDLEVTLPGIQAMADTTSWELFGVPLRVVAVQDPGGRKGRLWESFAANLTEDSDLIVETLQAALEPGMQLISDQGSPYMSEMTAEAIAAFECEHAPQKEGAPTEKAPKERAFRTVKDALKPLRVLSGKIAERVPALRNGAFARAVGRLFLACYLRVYESAPREGGHPLEGRSPTELQAIAEEQRERARADGRSVRLALSEIHREYHLPGSVEGFVRAHRHHALEDIQEAERRLRRKACRCELKACDLYYAGILRNVREENRARRRRERQRRIRDAEQQRQLQKIHEEAVHRSRLLREHPEVILEDGLDMVNAQWNERDRALFAEGRGLGARRIAEALESMGSANSHLVRDRAEVVWNTWATARGLTPQRGTAVRAVFERKLSRYVAPPPSLAALSRATIGLRPESSTRPPIRGPDLRNYEAGSWG